MNGGNISDGPSEDSGSDTELKIKSVPAEVNESMPAKTSTEKQLESLQFRFDELQLRWLQETEQLRNQLRYVKEASQKAIDGMHAQMEKNTSELVNARVKFDKYLVRNQELEDEVSVLQNRLDSLRELI